MRITRYLPPLALLLSFSVHAQSDLIGASGRFAQETGMKGAVANRELADRLYRQSLQDEAAAWKSFPPNAGLLSKALTHSKEAKQADDQAKEFARAALHGVNSANKSGELAKSNYSDLDAVKLRDLATNSSPYMPAVQNKLGSYGMKLDRDKTTLQTPFGIFSTGMEGGLYEKTLRGIATVLGYKAEDVSRGIQEAAKARAAMAREIDAKMNGLPSNAAQIMSAALPPPDLDGDGESDSGRTGGGRGPASAPAGADATDMAAAKIMEDEVSGAERADMMDENRQAFLTKLGVKGKARLDALADKRLNIFSVIHYRYQTLRYNGAFLEDKPPAPALASQIPANPHSR